MIVCRSSSDNGKTWRKSDLDIPAICSKLYIYTLSSGKTLVAFNFRGNGFARTRLCVGELDVENMCLTDIRTVACGMSDLGEIYHYPCIAEKDGRVMISCTVNNNNIRSAAMFNFKMC